MHVPSFASGPSPSAPSAAAFAGAAGFFSFSSLGFFSFFSLGSFSAATAAAAGAPAAAAGVGAGAAVAAVAAAVAAGAAATAGAAAGTGATSRSRSIGMTGSCGRETCTVCWMRSNQRVRLTTSARCFLLRLSWYQQSIPNRDPKAGPRAQGQPPEHKWASLPGEGQRRPRKRGHPAPFPCLRLLALVPLCHPPCPLLRAFSVRFFYHVGVQVGPGHDVREGQAAVEREVRPREQVLVERAHAVAKDLGVLGQDRRAHVRDGEREPLVDLRLVRRRRAQQRRLRGLGQVRRDRAHALHRRRALLRRHQHRPLIAQAQVDSEGGRG